MMILVDKSIGEQVTMLEIMVYKYILNTPKYKLKSDLMEMSIILDTEVTEQYLIDNIKHPSLILSILNAGNSTGLSRDQKQQLLYKILDYPNKIFGCLSGRIITHDMYSIIAKHVFEKYPDMTNQLYNFIPNKVIDKLKIKQCYKDILNSYRIMEMI